MISKTDAYQVAECTKKNLASSTMKLCSSHKVRNSTGSSRVQRLRDFLGTHPELLNMMKSIEEKRAKRIQKAEAWRNVKRINFEQQFGGLEYQANMDFIVSTGVLSEVYETERGSSRGKMRCAAPFCPS